MNIYIYLYMNMYICIKPTIPPPSRYGVIYYTYMYLNYSGIPCTRIPGVITQDRVLRGTLGQICQHAPMVNAPVTVERFLAPWR